MTIDPQKAKAIFLDVVEHHAPAQWTTYLQQACGDDVELRQWVEELLAAHREKDSLLDCVANHTPPTVDQPMSEKSGAQIGLYKLLQEIGQGGMGVVYMAVQHEPVRRQVALKIIKPGMDTRQVIARFEAERQALAMMDHPNIARVLDAGSTDTGRPYFVMELVNGIPVTQFCDEQHLTARERLELFIPICQAVQHAHQKGIIHRDIKPSNILVALYDGRPVPKVIDFGVAKATGGQLTDKTMFTGLGQIIGTLEYMSPEQAQRNQLDIDTRSDVYSLGVVLYELLTGDTPFGKQRLRSEALDELLRIIREEEPPKPSTKLSGSDTLPSVAANRQIEPAKLSALVRGELDWIVMKTLEKDRVRRYETANGLASDIQRYLNDEPVAACPPSAAYRFRKFARRNKAVLVTVGLVAGALVVGLAGTTWQAIRATNAERVAELQYEQAESARRSEAEQRRVAERRREEAEVAKLRAAEEAEVAKAVKSFLQNDLLAQADPANEANRDITLRRVLDRAAEKVAGRFEDKPVVEADIRDTLGHTYLGLGAYGEAEKHFARALTLYRETRGATHRDTIASLNNVAALREAMGRYAEAEPLFAEVLEISRKVLGREHSDTVICLNNLAWSLTMQGKYGQAEPLFVEALEIRRRTLGEEHEDVLDSMNDLGSLYLRSRRYELARPLFTQALEVRRRVLGADHPSTLVSLNNLAMLHKADRRYDEAEPLLTEVLAVRRRILGDQHPQTITSMDNLAGVRRAMGRLTEAEQLYQEAIAAAGKTLGDEHPTTLLARFNLAALYQATGRSADAEPLLRDVLKSVEKSPPTSVGLDEARFALGICLATQAKYTEAEPLLLQVCTELQQREDRGAQPVRSRWQQGVQKLIDLFEATERPEQAAEWRKKLGESATDVKEKD